MVLGVKNVYSFKTKCHDLEKITFFFIKVMHIWYCIHMDMPLFLKIGYKLHDNIGGHTDSTHIKLYAQK